MEGLTLQDPDLSVHALQYVARYDAMRLETYRLKENLVDRIRVSPLGPALALRFDDVGYFNRVYSADPAIFERLQAIEQFYSGSPFGCELVGPPANHLDGSGISRPGWTPAGRYAWMYGRDFSGGRLRSLPIPEATEFTIRSPEPSQQRLFLITYLRAFEAEPNRFPAALRNMAHLFDRPELDFFMAWHGGKPAGVGMMMRCGSKALLCAGAALPEFREMGCHAALLAARIRLASESGCEEIYSWAVLGGQSQTNMEKAGLCVVGTSTAWRLSPGRNA
jgi:hypothetical protein